MILDIMHIVLQFAFFHCNSKMMVLFCFMFKRCRGTHCNGNIKLYLTSYNITSYI